MTPTWPPGAGHSARADWQGRHTGAMPPVTLHIACLLALGAGPSLRIDRFDPGTLTITRIDHEGRTRARVEIRPLVTVGFVGWSVDWSDRELGLTGVVDHWLIGDRLFGRSETGSTSASWRLRVEPDGVVGERWRRSRAPSERELAGLRAARGLIIDALLEGCEEGLVEAEVALVFALRGHGRRGRGESASWGDCD